MLTVIARQMCEASTGNPGDGLDNDCDGYIDEDDCTQANRNKYMRTLITRASQPHQSVQTTKQTNKLTNKQMNNGGTGTTIRY